MVGVQGVAAAAMVITLIQTGLGEFLGLGALFGRDAEEGGRLRVGGLYRFVRHPLYTLGLIFIWATPEMTLTRLVLFAGMSIYFYLGSIYEERSLLRRFGEAYRVYASQVPRILPLPGRRYRTVRKT
jgi:protein-S-isoprenylcysteine O-methyltransferase Ste14